MSITQLSTGVRGLDEVLGGGIAQYSFNLIAGAPGTGKTTLSQQIMFALATPERLALHITVVGEPSLKMLRYHQQFTFFDKAKVGSCIHYVNLSNETLDAGLDAVLEAIVPRGGASQPGCGGGGGFVPDPHAQCWAGRKGQQDTAAVPGTPDDSSHKLAGNDLPCRRVRRE